MSNISLKEFILEADKMNTFFKEPSKSGFRVKELKKLMKELKKKYKKNG